MITREELYNELKNVGVKPEIGALDEDGYSHSFRFVLNGCDCKIYTNLTDFSRNEPVVVFVEITKIIDFGFMRFKRKPTRIKIGNLIVYNGLQKGCYEC